MESLLAESKTVSSLNDFKKLIKGQLFFLLYMLYSSKQAF